MTLNIAKNRLAALTRVVVDCTKCPRLVDYRGGISGKGLTYWNRPVPGFGDPRARLLILGLAPGAHGANRTGRPFTGDAAGDFLYRGLFEVGLANRPQSTSSTDDLTLRGAYISNVVRCVPPENKPTPEEIAACADHFSEEMAALADVRTVLALGRIAHEGFLNWRKAGHDSGLRKRDYPFSHGARHELRGGMVLYDSYHTSRYNTSTGVLTWKMFRDVLTAAAGAAAAGE